MSEAQTLEQKLEVRTGRLADTLSFFEPETISHSHEIMTARRTDSSLRNQWFWTADFPMYRVEGGDAVLYFASREHNLIFRNIQDATAQLLANQNYVPRTMEMAEVTNAVSSGDVLRINLSDLRLIGNDNEWRYFEINTANHDSLNPSERAFAERIYGQSNEFLENMKMLKKSKIDTTKVYVLNPTYVQARLEDNENGAIARASWMGRFGGGSGFGAIGRDVDSLDGGLRGVLKSAEGAAPKIGEKSAIQYSPEGILEYLRLNPINHAGFAASLLDHVNRFYNPKT